MILIDTHVVVWLSGAPELLSSAASDAIHNARQTDGIAISGKSLWELAMLIERGRIQVKGSALDTLQAVEETFTVLPITAAVADKAVRLSGRYPKDPTDRIIGATAVVHGLTLITRDQQIQRSGEVSTLW